MLILLRHAKSSWTDPSLGDFDRPLAPRGRKAAPRMGAFIAERGLIPDLVLCSGSARTRETLALAAAKWPSRPETVYDDALYHATVPGLLAQLHAAPDAKRHVMMVGHNPDLHEFALQLAGFGDGLDLRNLAHKFPTGALAVLTFDKTRWRDIDAGGGRLTVFVTPKTLRKAD